MNELDCAYLAGYIDGDGCFYIDKIKAKTGPYPFVHRTVLKFASVDICIMEWLNQQLGINFWEKVVYKKLKHLPRRTVYEANLTGNSLDLFLPKIYPFLRIKKRHCEIMMNIRKTYQKPAKGVIRSTPSPETYAFRQLCHHELSSLNIHKLLNPSALSPSA